MSLREVEGNSFGSQQAGKIGGSNPSRGQLSTPLNRSLQHLQQEENTNEKEIEYT